MRESTGPAVRVVEVATAQIERAAARWLARFTSHHTRRAYVADLTSWLSHCAGTGVDPTLAGPDDVDAWRRSLESAGQRPRTVARRLASVASWHRFLVAEGLRTTAPEVARPREVDGPRSTVSREIVDRLLAAAAPDPAATALIQLLASTDLRVSELLDCDVEDLGQHRGRAVLRIAGGPVELTAATVRAMRAHLRDRISGPLFRTGTGARMTQPTAWRLVRRVARQADLPDPDAVNPRSLRAASVP
ncbi:tyrosine-type recombinase/integrase [Pseudonocardia sp. CA-107938]|uniref:tyrosine-type recombinase/integrase n=1 Tax=Pseudonocardia sp. CA-107938 TaxID=3240021 RepID=UPI003D8B2136